MSRHRQNRDRTPLTVITAPGFGVYMGDDEVVDIRGGPGGTGELDRDLLFHSCDCGKCLLCKGERSRLRRHRAIVEMAKRISG